MVLLWQHFEDGAQALMYLVECKVLFGIVAGIGMAGESLLMIEVLCQSTLSLASLKGKIVSHAKEPAVQVPARASALQMMEEREKCLLDDVLGVVMG